MSSSLRVAAIQLSGERAPLDVRLAQASAAISQAVAEGATLVVLPQQFNTGYDYTEQNYEQAETMTGATASWLERVAIHHNIWLAGSWLVQAGDHVYDRAVLAGPDGRKWWVDKQHHFAWERTFCREGNDFSIAETPLGRIGFLIGWDVAHADRWARYAGRVDLLLVLATFPDWRAAYLQRQAEERRPLFTLGDHYATLAETSACLWDEHIPRQATWMSVPVVCAMSSGTLRTYLPAPTFSVGALVANEPGLWSWLRTPDEVFLVAPFEAHTAIYHAQGMPLASAGPDTQTIVAEISLPHQRPYPQDDQPDLPVAPLALTALDGIASSLLMPSYRRGLRRQWGARMAPLDAQTQRWGQLLGVLTLMSFVLGWWLARLERRNLPDHR